MTKSPTSAPIPPKKATKKMELDWAISASTTVAGATVKTETKKYTCHKTTNKLQFLRGCQQVFKRPRFYKNYGYNNTENDNSQISH